MFSQSSFEYIIHFAAFCFTFRSRETCPSFRAEPSILCEHCHWHITNVKWYNSSSNFWLKSHFSSYLSDQVGTVYSVVGLSYIVTIFSRNLIFFTEVMLRCIPCSMNDLHKFSQAIQLVKSSTWTRINLQLFALLNLYYEVSHDRLPSWVVALQCPLFSERKILILKLVIRWFGSLREIPMLSINCGTPEYRSGSVWLDQWWPGSTLSVCGVSF